MRSILIDAGPLIALFAVDDKHHDHYDQLVSEFSATRIREIMTTDVRDFSRYRLPDGQSFAIL